jgi:hypothetical protein
LITIADDLTTMDGPTVVLGYSQAYPTFLEKKIIGI